MIKKILIGVLIIIVFASTALYITYKKVEAQFESFVMGEIARREAEIDKALEERIGEIEMPQIAVSSESETLDLKEPVEDTHISNEGSEALTLESDAKPIDKVIQEKIDERATENRKNEDVVLKPEDPVTREEPVAAKDPIVVKEPIAVVEPIREKVEHSEEKKEVPEVIEKKVYESDKAKAMALALSRLTASQISRLITISKDGFIAEERKEAKEMFYSNFTEAEQEWILGLYSKYY